MTQLRNVGNEELKAVVVLSDFPSMAGKKHLV